MALSVNASCDPLRFEQVKNMIGLYGTMGGKHQIEPGGRNQAITTNHDQK